MPISLTNTLFLELIDGILDFATKFFGHNGSIDPNSLGWVSRNELRVGGARMIRHERLFHKWKLSVKEAADGKRNLVCLKQTISRDY